VKNTSFGYLIILTLLAFVRGSAAEVVELGMDDKSARVEIELGQFAEDHHQLQYREIESGGQKYRVLEKIDGHDYSGTDGSLPTVEILKVGLFAGNECFELPSESFRSLFEPGLESRIFRTDEAFARDESGSGVQLQFWFKDGKGLLSWRGGDGAGAYTATWEVHLGSNSVKRILSQFPEPEVPEVSTFKLMLTYQPVLSRLPWTKSAHQPASPPGGRRCFEAWVEAGPGEAR
jgi:hypothetical protein